MYILYSGTTIKMIMDLPSETMEARGENIF